MRELPSPMTETPRPDSLPAPLNELDGFQIEELVKLMQEPVRSIYKCISKGQLQTLCQQLLAQNLALQMRIKDLEQK